MAGTRPNLRRGIAPVRLEFAFPLAESDVIPGSLLELSYNLKVDIPELYHESIVEVSVLILIGVALAWAVTQVFTIFAARWVLQGAKDDAQSHREDVVEHFNDKLESFEGRFNDAYKTDMNTLAAEMDRIPKRIAMTFNSEKGAEVRSLQAYIEREGVDVDEAVQAVESNVMMEHPEAMAALALKRAYDADVSDVYRKENPVKAFIFDAGKAVVLPQLEQAFMGTSTLAGRKKSSTGPYGM